jgi:ribosomal protein RSM22 (predicted rRNA methylase)
MVVLGCSIDEVIMLIPFTHVPRCTWRLSNGKCVSFCFTKVVQSRLKRPLKSASKIGRWSSENISSNCTILSKRRCTRSHRASKDEKGQSTFMKKTFLQEYPQKKLDCLIAARPHSNSTPITGEPTLVQWTETNR